MNIREQIDRELKTIQEINKVRVLFACESGSRAWGFPSQDSDYDVRFLYVRSPEWYLSIDVENKPDVIERPISDDLDVSGWDLRKAFQLLRKSNPPLLEWLNSPIIYLSKVELMNAVKSLVSEYYSPIACHYHYLHMAKGNYKAYLTASLVSHKKYFYVLRPLLAIKWIEENRGIVPVPFATLITTVVQDAILKKAIEDLIEKKKQGFEEDKEQRIAILSDFIEQELSRWENKAIEYSGSTTSAEKLNNLFRLLLVKAWEEN